MTPLEKVSEMRDAGFGIAEIRLSMRQNGFTHEQITAAFEAYDAARTESFKARNPVLSNRFTPLILAGVCYLVFFHLIPDDIAEAHYIFFSMIGGLLSMVLCFWAVVKLAPAILDRFPIGTGIVSIGMIFLFAFAFISRTSDYSSGQLRDHGASTMARIVDKSYIPGRRGNGISSLTVHFRVGSDIVEAEMDVSRGLYESLDEGRMIPIVYSTENPTIVAIDYEHGAELRRMYGR